MLWKQNAGNTALADPKTIVTKTNKVFDVYAETETEKIDVDKQPNREHLLEQPRRA